MRFRKWPVPCLTVDKVRTDDTKSCQVSQLEQGRGGTAAHLIVAPTDLFNLVLLLLDEAVETAQVQLLGVRLLYGLDERRECLEVLGGRRRWVEGDLMGQRVSFQVQTNTTQV